MGEGTTRRGTATPVHRPQRPAGSTHRSTRGLRPPEQLERPAGFPSSDKTRPDSPVPHSTTPEFCASHHSTPPGDREDGSAPGVPRYPPSGRECEGPLLCKDQKIPSGIRISLVPKAEERPPPQVLGHNLAPGNRLTLELNPLQLPLAPFRTIPLDVCCGPSISSSSSCSIWLAWAFELSQQSLIPWVKVSPLKLHSHLQGQSLVLTDTLVTNVSVHVCSSIWYS